jgi:hypothetical protein
MNKSFSLSKLWFKSILLGHDIELTRLWDVFKYIPLETQKDPLEAYRYVGRILTGRERQGDKTNPTKMIICSIIWSMEKKLSLS